MSTALQGRLERLDSSLDVTALGAEWRNLESSCNASFFISWGWIGPWLEMVLPAGDVYLFRAQCGQETVALGLISRFRYRRNKIFPTLALSLNEMRGGGLNMTIEHNDLLCVPDHLPSARSLMLKTLLKAPFRWHELHLAGVPAGWHEAAHPYQGMLYRGSVEQRAPWAADISHQHSLDAVMARFSRNRRAQIRRSVRHFETRLGPLRVEQVGTLQEAFEVFDEMGRMHTARWQRAGLAGSWANARWVGFHREVIRNGFSRGEIQLLSISAGDTLLGAIYSFLWRGRVYMLQTGFIDARDNVERPGYVAHSLAMAFNANQGMTSYDFMCGDADYKRSMAQAEEPLEWITFRRNTAGNRFQDRLIDMYRKLPHRTAGAQEARIPVIVLGEGVTALGVTRAFGREGIPVYGTSHHDQVLRSSRFYRDLPGLGQEALKPLAANLARALEASGLERGVLFACSDHFCKAVAELPSELRQRFPSRMPTAETLALLNDKVRERIDIGVVVLDDGKFGYIERQQLEQFGVASGTRLGDVDIEAVSVGLGAGFREAHDP